MPGISVTALCVPAREVGGDYYDFFHVGDRRLGVLIADVSGKGTSAALYMAELKGLMLSLSQIYQSPRQLLIEVNRIMSENLDTRSFITMTYAVIDLNAGTADVRARRAHAAHLPVRRTRDSTGAQVLAPSGMVVGLRIPGAARSSRSCSRKISLSLNKGDVLVLLYRRHHRGDERRQRSVRRRAARPAGHGARPPRRRPTCASGSCARSKPSSAPPISTTT